MKSKVFVGVSGVTRQSRRHKMEQNRIVGGICVKVRVEVSRWTRRV